MTLALCPHRHCMIQMRIASPPDRLVPNKLPFHHSKLTLAYSFRAPRRFLLHIHISSAASDSNVAAGRCSPQQAQGNGLCGYNSAVLFMTVPIDGSKGRSRLG